MASRRDASHFCKDKEPAPLQKHPDSGRYAIPLTPTLSPGVPGERGQKCERCRMKSFTALPCRGADDGAGINRGYRCAQPPANGCHPSGMANYAIVKDFFVPIGSRSSSILKRQFASSGVNSCTHSRCPHWCSVCAFWWEPSTRPDKPILTFWNSSSFIETKLRLPGSFNAMERWC